MSEQKVKITFSLILIIIFFSLLLVGLFVIPYFFNDQSLISRVFSGPYGLFTGIWVIVILFLAYQTGKYIDKKKGNESNISLWSALVKIYEEKEKNDTDSDKMK